MRNISDALTEEEEEDQESIWSDIGEENGDDKERNSLEWDEEKNKLAQSENQSNRNREAKGGNSTAQETNELETSMAVEDIGRLSRGFIGVEQTACKLSIEQQIALTISS